MIPPLAAVICRGVSKFFGDGDARVTALDRVDLEVAPGELTLLVGPSGCGKTTLLNAIDGLIRPTGGRILVDGRAVSGPGSERAMVFQHDSLFPWRTVAQNITYGLDLQGTLTPAERRTRAQVLVDLVGLSGFAEHYPHELSGGMRQRVNIARALAVGDGKSLRVGGGLAFAVAVEQRRHLGIAEAGRLRSVRRHRGEHGCEQHASAHRRLSSQSAKTMMPLIMTIPPSIRPSGVIGVTSP